MSDVQDAIIVNSATGDSIATSESFKMPLVDYPKVELPEAPKTGLPENVEHPSSDGESFAPVVGDNSRIDAPTKPRILIGVPILSYSHEFVESFMKFWTSICTMKDKNFEAGYYFMHRKPVHMAEIGLVEIAQHNKCTHILLMDDDIYDIKLEDLEKLLAADKDVIGGVMYASGFPYAMCAFRRFNPERKVIDMPVDNSMYRLYEVPCACPKCKNGMSHWDAKFCPVCGSVVDNMIQQCDLIPFAFTLMKVSVFDKIKKPWFHCTENYPTDSWFADRLLEAGLTEYETMGIWLNHRGVNRETRDAYFQMGLAKTKAQGGVLNISQEDMEKHQYMLHNKMKEAEERLKPKVGVV